MQNPVINNKNSPLEESTAVANKTTETTIGKNAVITFATAIVASRLTLNEDYICSRGVRISLPKEFDDMGRLLKRVFGGSVFTSANTTRYVLTKVEDVQKLRKALKRLPDFGLDERARLLGALTTYAKRHPRRKRKPVSKVK